MSSRGFQLFSSAFLAFESGVDPALLDWYVEHLDKPVMRYWRVLAPGQVERDRITGEPLSEVITVSEYFERIGVRHMFDPEVPTCLETMQAHSTNPWGFVGFQFGEALLIDLGYYVPRVTTCGSGAEEREVPVYYVGSVSCANFASGRHYHLDRRGEPSEWVMATDVNRWEGRFTGLDGIASMADLKTPRAQRAVFARALTHNHRILERALGPLDSVLLRPENSHISLSGILAASHLVGAEAAARRVAGGRAAYDEAGTSADLYLDKFSGFDISFEDFAACMSPTPCFP